VFVSVEWCKETITRQIPEDPEQYITVRRLNGRERRRRQSLGGKFIIGDGEAVSMELAIDAIKDFEYETCITDFRLKDENNKLLVFGNREYNKNIYDNMSDELCRFVDDLIAEVNKENAAGKEEMKEVEGN